MRARVFEVERLEFLARSALLRLHDIFRNRIVCPGEALAVDHRPLRPSRSPASAGPVKSPSCQSMWSADSTFRSATGPAGPLAARRNHEGTRAIPGAGGPGGPHVGCEAF